MWWRRSNLGSSAGAEATFERGEGRGAVEPGTAAVDVIACVDEATLDVVAVARDADDRVVALELVPSIPYLPVSWPHVRTWRSRSTTPCP